MSEPMPKCSQCGRPADLLCDFIIAREMAGIVKREGQPPHRVVDRDSRHFTCDRPICEACTTKGSPEFYCGKNGFVHVDDYCPEHAGGQQYGDVPILTEAEAVALRLRSNFHVFESFTG